MQIKQTSEKHTTYDTCTLTHLAAEAPTTSWSAYKMRAWCSRADVGCCCWSESNVPSACSVSDRGLATALPFSLHACNKLRITCAIGTSLSLSREASVHQDSIERHSKMCIGHDLTISGHATHIHSELAFRSDCSIFGNAPVC